MTTKPIRFERKGCQADKLSINTYPSTGAHEITLWRVDKEGKASRIMGVVRVAPSSTIKGGIDISVCGCR
jgi:hypothetical protein